MNPPLVVPGSLAIMRNDYLRQHPGEVAPSTVSKINPLMLGLLTEDEAASYLSIMPRTLRLWRNTRGLPHIKITSKVIRYRLRDLEAWLERLRQVIN